MASTLTSPETNLLLHRREVLRAHFVADVAAGTARPFVLPFDLLGTVLLPIIYLCIPHTRRPWLYRLRFAVVGLMVWLNYNMMMTASSTNFAAACMVGLLGVWGTLWGTTRLVWMRPQFDAERVDVHGDVYGDVNRGVIRRYTIGTVKENGGTHGNPKPGGCNSAAPDQTVAAALSAGYTYYWQSYPSDSPLSTRLGWAFDYATSIRGPGWSTTSISSIPSFRRPSKPLSDSPVDLSSIPLQTLTGFSRYTTSLSFLAHRLRQMALAYIVFDFLSFAMQNDPYFILGPEHAAAHPLPPYLSSLHPLVLPIFRSSLVVTAIIASAHLAMGIAQLLHFCVSHSHPTLIRLAGARSDIWQYPDVCGGFATNVLDYGLAGFWGGWWHQNFRACFVAPANWLAQHGYLPRDRRHPVRRFAGAAIAFVLSGISY
ncbi:hypothetical protein GE09DRAFT_1046458 [Coniochaeta sp. 2T2.1]|nr:hypothetical protein GE09DRAFT_1046458 [Coniochaeta sp. 2T2.1]